MLKKYAPAALFVSVVIALSTLAINFAYRLGSDQIDKKIEAIRPCSASELDSFVRYITGSSNIVIETHDIERQNPDNPAAIAQQVNELKDKFRSLTPPACASAHDQALGAYLDNLTKEYVERARGGFMAEVKAYYYHTIANDNLFLATAILSRLIPEMAPNNWQTA